MQDDINERSITLGARVSKLTATELKKVADKLLAELQGGNLNPLNKQSTVKHGKMTIKELAKQNAGLSSIELTDPHLRLLKRNMNQYGIDFSIAKDGRGKYTLFFKGRDAETITHAFSQYTEKLTSQAARPSITSTLNAMKQAAKQLTSSRDKAKRLDKGERSL